MIYCQHCASKNPDGAEVCQKCGEVIEATLENENERPLVQKLHQKENVSREKIDSAMAFIVLGIIFIVMGAIFFVLSFKLPNATAINKELSFTCFEFYVSVVGLGGGGAMLIYGLVKLIRHLGLLKVYKQDIDEIRANKSPTVSK